MNDEGDPRLTPADFAAILATTLAMATEAGVTIGVRATEANDRRPAGLLLFVSGLTVDPSGQLAVLEPAQAMQD